MNNTGEWLSWMLKLNTIALFLTIIVMLMLLARFWEVTLSGDKVCRRIGRHPLTPLTLAEINFAAIIVQFFDNNVASVVSTVSSLKLSTLTTMTDGVIITIQIIVILFSLIYQTVCELEIYKTIPAEDPASIDNLFGVKKEKSKESENKNEKD